MVKRKGSMFLGSIVTTCNAKGQLCLREVRMCDFDGTTCFHYYYYLLLLLFTICFNLFISFFVNKVSRVITRHTCIDVDTTHLQQSVLCLRGHAHILGLQRMQQQPHDKLRGFLRLL